jgi:hypothetical protein
VFLAESLCYNLNNLLSSQANTSSPLIRVIINNKYKVQKIIAIKLIREKLAYQAKWTNTDKDPEFYPVLNFKYSLHLLKRFHLANPTLPGPPANLPLWL